MSIKFKSYFLFVLFLVFFGMAEKSEAATYWISSTGAAANLAACSGVTPLSGTSACSYDKANGSGVVAGDTVYYRAGTYNISDGAAISPANSGTSADNRIIFSAYSGEVVAFVGTATGCTTTGINIANKNWIKVTGVSDRNMTFSDFAYFVNIWDGQSGSENFGVGSDYNEISYCSFSQTSSQWISINCAAESSKLMHNSTYNWIHHNTFSKSGGYTATNDVSALLNLGWEDCGLYTNNVCQDDTHDNVIEDNIMYHGGHQVIGIFNYNNVVRNNIFHNEPWYLGTDGVRHGYRVIQTQSSYNTDYHHSYNLIEGNRVSHASENMIPSNQGGTGVHLSISYTVMRYNSFYANAGNAVFVEVHDKTYGRTNYNHIYNNTFFANGYGATFPTGGPPGRTDPPNRSTFYFAASEAQFPTIQYGNVIKNNLSWKDYSTSQADYWTVRYDSNDGWRNMTEGLCAGYAICGDTVISNNWFHANGDPKFVNEGSYSTPSVLTQNYEWYQAAPDGSDVTTINTEPDFSLQSSSPAIDGGTYLTQANGSGNSTTTLVVDDASYFQPGWGNGAGGGAAVAADWIAIGTTANVQEIASINYATNTITLLTPATWDDNANIWLVKKSDGDVVLAGSAPEYGAYEYDGADVTAPFAPSGLSVI